MKTSVLARKPPVGARFQGHVLRPGHGRHRAAAQNAAAQARARSGARAPPACGAATSRGPVLFYNRPWVGQRERVWRSQTRSQPRQPKGPARP